MVEVLILSQFSLGSIFRFLILPIAYSLLVDTATRRNREGSCPSHVPFYVKSSDSRTYPRIDAVNFSIGKAAGKPEINYNAIGTNTIPGMLYGY